MKLTQRMATSLTATLGVFVFVSQAFAYDPLNGDFSRADESHVRIVSYNTERNLVDTSSTDDEYERILTTLDPDVIVFQEIITEVSNAQVKAKLDQWIPIGGAGWEVHRGTGGFIQNMVASRFPLEMERTDTSPSASTRGVTMALLDLPDSEYSTDIYLMGVHFKCCDNETEDQEKRQRSADAIAYWLADARTPGGFIDLPVDTPMIVAGDFNLVGGDNGNQPEQTLLTGDIQDEVTFGPDRPGDWDGSSILDLTPTNPSNGSTGTWRSSQSFPSSRLDRFLISDSVITVANSGILNTKTLSNSALTASGLFGNDTEIAADHLPIYMDLDISSLMAFYQVDRDAVACNDSLPVTLRDPNNPDAGSITVQAESSGGSSIPLTLTENETDSSLYEGVLLTTGSSEEGRLTVADGDTVTLRYQDSDTGEGNPGVVDQQLTVDCDPPEIDLVQIVAVTANGAMVNVGTDEETIVTLEYGSSCGSLVSSVKTNTFDSNTQIIIDELQPSSNYFFRVIANDRANNSGIDDNGGTCYTFRTNDQPNYFTESFIDNSFDLENTSILFIPNNDGYDICRTPITQFPYPEGEDSLNLGDDDSIEISLNNGNQFPIAGESFDSVFIGSNGYLTFAEGDTEFSTSLANHFDVARVSFLFDDLTPSGTAMTSQQYDDRLVITGIDVAEFSSSTRSSFQVELMFDGTVRLSYLNVEATDSIMGISTGQGVPSDYVDWNMSGSVICPTAEGWTIF